MVRNKMVWYHAFFETSSAHRCKLALSPLSLRTAGSAGASSAASEVTLFFPVRPWRHTSEWRKGKTRLGHARTAGINKAFICVQTVHVIYTQHLLLHW